MRNATPLSYAIRVLDDSDIMFQVGPSTWAKGLTLWRTGKVESTQWDGKGSASARVKDTGLSYKTWIADGVGRLELTCACTIGRDCAHAVAALLALREQARELEPEKSGWKTALAQMIGESGISGEPLGLLVDAHDPSSEIWLRPLRPGTRVAWTEKRATWPDLTSTQWESVTDGINATHLALMRQGYRISRESEQWHSRGEVALGSLGDQAFGWLTRLSRAGVTLLASLDPLTPLVLDRSTWDLDLDAQATQEGLALVPVARNGEQIARRPRLNAAMGMLILEGGTRLARVNGISLLEAMPATGNIEIPSHDLADFRANWLPSLRRQFSLTSSDRSFEIVDKAQPQVVATVRTQDNDSIVVRWWAEFDFGGSTSRILLSRALDDPQVQDLAEMVDELGKRAPSRLYQPGPATIRLPAWRTPELLKDLVQTMQDPCLVWDIAAEVADIKVDDRGMRISASIQDGPSDWFDLKVRIDVGGHEVALEEILGALARDEQYLLSDSTWVRLDGERIRVLKSLLDEAQMLSAESSIFDQPRISLIHMGLWDDLEGAADDVTASQTWSKRLDMLRGVSTAGPLPVSPSCRAQLRPYQASGHDWLTVRARMGLGGILADDMGLGKTIQILSAIRSILESSQDSSQPSGPVLVVAPTSVLTTWKHEAERFFPNLKVRTVTETARRRSQPLAQICQGADVVVTSYTILRLEVDDFSEQEFCGLVIDEAQAAKNPRTAIHRALAGIRRPWTFAVTGTPVENSVTDLWSIMSLTTPGLLPGWKTFNDSMRRRIEQEDDSEALERLHRLTSPFILRRTKEEVAPELPDKIESVIEVELGEEHRHIYDQFLTRERAKILSLIDDYSNHRIDVLASITRLRQFALDPALVDDSYDHVGSSKIEFLAQQLDQIVPRGHQVLVFSQFTSFLERIRRVLERRGLSVVQLDGSTRDRQGVIEQFRSGQSPVFLISLKAGGTGLTLTEADYVYMMDPWWNPAAEAQAVDRAHRIGQTKKVNVYRLVAQDTIEHKVLDLQERKRQLVTSVIEGGGTGGRIDIEDLRSLLSQ
ncbi:DEAD/DEAH box helicase [Schaalia vaccimaxillae]|uniref:DEAD/DEAH box helicase n=1 Tax=Schaalia vaccimaxillae TaxID=183916 RepID=UPI0003B47F67|nr:DEAD/DEAH box helicase [Schaalia vaccimaxillae]